MNNTNKVVYVIIVVLAIVAVGACYSLGISKYKLTPSPVQSGNKTYTFTELGVQEVSLADCDVFKKQTTNYPLSVSFTIKDVAGARSKVKDLASKYNADVTYDNMNSYPGQSYQDSASLTFSIKEGLDKFNQELNALIKTMGGDTSNYSYQSNYGYGSTPYNSCQTSFQTVMTDKTQLEILTNAMLMEKDPQRLATISQSVATTKTTLQNDISSFTETNRTSSTPSISVSISAPYNYPSARGE